MVYILRFLDNIERSACPSSRSSRHFKSQPLHCVLYDANTRGQPSCSLTFCSTFIPSSSAVALASLCCAFVFMLQVPSAEVEADVYQAAAYVARHTMKVLEELFTEAR